MRSSNGFESRIFSSRKAKKTQASIEKPGLLGFGEDYFTMMDLVTSPFALRTVTV